MVSTFTANKNMELMAYNEDINTWGDPKTNNNLKVIDAALGGLANITVSNVNIQLVNAVGTNSSQPFALYFSGTLGNNINIFFPTPGFWWVWADGVSNPNNYFVTLAAGTGGVPVSGGFTVQLNSGGQLIYSDGSSILTMSRRIGGPIGAITAYANPTPPQGWLACNGGAINRNRFYTLFQTIGGLYGAGDGSTTFNVPDLRARFPVGYDASNATGRLTGAVTGSIPSGAGSFAGVGGEEFHLLSTLEMALHQHDLQGHTHGPAGSVGHFWGEGGTSKITLGGTQPLIEMAITGGPSPNNTGLAGGSNAHNNVPPAQVVQFMICAGGI